VPSFVSFCVSCFNGSAVAGAGLETDDEGAGALAMLKENSSASEDDSHGTCSLREARVTPTRVRLSVSSAVRPGTRISFSNSLTNKLRSLPPSLTTELNAAEYI